MRFRFFPIISVGEIGEAGGRDGCQFLNGGAGERNSLVGGAKEDVDFEGWVGGGGRRRRQEVDDGVGVGGGDGAQEGAGVEETGIEEVGADSTAF